MSGKPLVLTILDGWGYSPAVEGNAIAAARKPTYDALLRDYPNTLVQTSGPSVGLPDGQMGNSEVGHLNIGAGRVIHMDVTRIDLMIASRFSQFEEMSGLRKTWNRFGVWCMRQRTGFDITDSQSGFRYYSSKLLRRVQLNSSGYNLEMEILMKAWKLGFVLGSTPIAARIADGRATSHFRPFRDTVAICMTFLRYM